MATQGDFFQDAETAQVLDGIRSLEIVASRLPSKPFVTPVEVALALDTKVDTVYRWIDSGLFEYLDLGSGEHGKRRYRINLTSFLTFLKSRINRI